MAKKKSLSKTKHSSKKKSHTPKEPFFIGLSDPVELRKNLLEPTREVIQFLQSYEQFKKTKEEKTHSIIQLKEELKQIRVEANKLKKLLPKSKIHTHSSLQKDKKEIKSPPPESEAPKPLPKLPTELEALEKELSSIEKKLGTLS